MSDVNWANAVSMVATADGLLVTERGADGQVGATYSPRLLRSMAQQSAQRTPSYATPPDFTPDGVSQVRQRLLAWAENYLQYAFIDEYMGYANKYKGVWGWEDIDEYRAKSFIEWWNKNVAGTPVQGKQGQTYGGLYSCPVGAGSVCSVLTAALANSLIYWETMLYIGDKGLGAAAPWDRPPVRDAVLDYANQKKLPEKPQLPMTPEEFDDRFPPSRDLKMSCTDSALKTYRFEISGGPKILKKFGDPGRQTNTFPLFKACSDTDAWGIFFGAGTLHQFLDEAYCYRLYRLDAKPGYASAWTFVKEAGGNCQYGHSG